MPIRIASLNGIDNLGRMIIYQALAIFILGGLRYMRYADFEHKCEHCKKDFELIDVELHDESVPINEDGEVDEEDGVAEPWYVFSHEQDCDHCGKPNEIEGTHNDIPDGTELHKKPSDMRSDSDDDDDDE